MAQDRNQELFLAILALESYNRGYEPGMVIGGRQIGTATLGDATDDTVEPGAAAAANARGAA